MHSSVHLLAHPVVRLLVSLLLLLLPRILTEGVSWTVEMMGNVQGAPSSSSCAHYLVLALGVLAWGC